MGTTHLNLPTLHANPASSPAVRVDPPASLVVVGGQNGVEAGGEVVGDDVAAQAEQALRNVRRAVEVVHGLADPRLLVEVAAVAALAP